MLVAALALLALAGLTEAEVVQRGQLRVSFDGRLTPRALPRQGAAPVRVAVDAKFAATDGGTPPQLRQIAIAINRYGRFSPQGLPICRLREIQPSTTANALAACRSSLVGEGRFSAKVLLGQQSPFPADGKVLAFNGVLHGRPAILAHVYGTEPVPTSFTLPFALEPAKGTYRHRPARLPAGGDRGFRLRHRALAEPRSQLQLPRPGPQLPQCQLPRPQRLPRRRLPLRPGQLRVCGEDRHLDPDPKLQGAPMSRLLALAIAAGALLLLAPASASAVDLGTIEGTVTAPVAVDEVEVCIVEANPSETCTYPGPGGGYSLAVIPGRYRVEFLPSYRSHLLRQYYNGKASLEEAVLVTVRPKEETKGIDAHLLLGGQIEGRVTAAVGADPLEDVEACALSSDGSIGGCDGTNANGEYAIPTLAPNVYRVGFWGEGKSAAYATHYYSDGATFLEADPITLAAGATAAGIDAQMQVGARLKGTVRDASGQALGGIAVCLFAAGGTQPERCTASADDGRYGLPGLSSGSYTVAFSPEFREFAGAEFLPEESDGYLTQYYEGQSTLALATTLSLLAPRVVSGVDAYLLRPPAVVPAGLQPAPATPSFAAPQGAAASPPGHGPAKCRRGFRKRTVKGKVRCVKVHHRKRQRRHKGGVRKGLAS